MRLVEFYEQDQDIYNDFVVSQPQSVFLQGWAWGEFQRKLGKKVWRLGIKQSNQLISTAQFISQPWPLDKSYLYIPRGPIAINGLSKEMQQQILELYLSKARDICYITKKQSEIFVRFEPTQSFTQSAIITMPLIKAKSIQPEHTWMIDLLPDEKDLLQAMHSKTRYNIHLAAKKDVKIIQSNNNKKDLNKFLFLMKITAARAGIKLWPDQHYIKMIEYLNQQKMATLWLAEYQGETIVANLVINFGDTVTYLHGGSANKYKEVMAPQYLQWQQIQWAKKQGYRYYDFWGIAPEGSNKADAWQGITRFKKNFGGEQVDYHGTYDFVYSTTWYALYKLIKKFK